MLAYVMRRIIILPIILLLMSFVLFALMLQIPSEQRAEIYMLSGRPNISPELSAEILQKVIDRYGLDRPLHVQYISWIRNLFMGDWGYSPMWRQPVLEGLLYRTPASLELAFVASLPAIILALFLGTIAARYNDWLSGQAIRFVSFIAWAFPSFILALLLMMFFYAWQGWFPPGRLTPEHSALVASDAFNIYTGMYTIDSLLNRNWTIFWDAIRHLILPGLTLGISFWGLLTRVLRDSLLDVLNQDFITTARAKGISERRVINKHARRNAILPVISTGGVVVSLLISTMVIVETIFNIDGIGKASVQAILNGDVPVVIGFTLFVSIASVLLSLVADVLYGVVDPRVRLY